MATNNSINAPRLDTDGQLLIGSTGNRPVAALPIAGSRMQITAGPGSLTFAATAGDDVVDQTGTSVTMASNTVYIVNAGASLCTLTLPAAPALGDWVEVDGFSSGLFRIAQTAGQKINFGDLPTTVGVTGYVEATNRYDVIKLRCVNAPLEWDVVSSQGNLTVA